VTLAINLSTFFIHWNTFKCALQFMFIKSRSRESGTVKTKLSAMRDKCVSYGVNGAIKDPDT